PSRGGDSPPTSRPASPTGPKRIQGLPTLCCFLVGRGATRIEILVPDGPVPWVAIFRTDAIEPSPVYLTSLCVGHPRVCGHSQPDRLGIAPVDPLCLSPNAPADCN